MLPKGHEHIPLAEIILMVGFYLIYFVEEFVHFVCDSDLHDHDARDFIHENEMMEEVATKRRKQSIGVHK